MLEINVFTDKEGMSAEKKEEIVEFLYTHLERFGDPKEQIRASIEYAMKETEAFGGYVLEGKLEGNTVGAVVVNKTGMKGYIPDNILVYIAVDASYRGKGLGRELMEKTFEIAEGDVKLHVEPDNPAKFLYEKVGMTSKYLEMRYKK